MTSIDSRIISAVSPIVTEVHPNRYKGTADEYCVFTYQEMPDAFAESFPGAITCSVQLSYYLPHGHNPLTKKRNIARALSDAGFTYPSILNASDNEGQHYVFECQGIGDP